MFSVLELVGFWGFLQQQNLTEKFKFTNTEALHKKKKQVLSEKFWKATQGWDLIYGKYQGERTQEMSSNRLKSK